VGYVCVYKGAHAEPQSCGGAINFKEAGHEKV